MTENKNNTNNLLSVNDSKKEEKHISFKSFKYSFSDSVNNSQNNNNNNNDNLKSSEHKIKEFEKLAKTLIDKKEEGSSDSSFDNYPGQEIHIDQFKDNDENDLVSDNMKEKEKNKAIKKQTNLINDFYNNRQNSVSEAEKLYTNPNEKEIILNTESPSFSNYKEKNETDSVSTPLFGLDSEKISELAVERIIKRIEPIKINIEIEGNFVEKLMKELEEADKETWGNFGVGKKVIIGGRYNNNRKEDESEAFSYPYKDNSLCYIF